MSETATGLKYVSRKSNVLSAYAKVSIKYELTKHKLMGGSSISK